jgi:adenine-specific DNA-methyltransferase
MKNEIKLPLTSADVTEALLAQLRESSPQIFSEGKVDFAKLQAALGEHISTDPERYGLTWAGKRDAFRNVQVPSVATLRPQPTESVNWDSTENLIIEGDNLEVLKLLQKPYHGKVKMIYIDPPYNTGNEFIYPDNFREGLDEYLRYTQQLSEEGTATSTNKETSGRYHSNWLNMMYPRLFLARNLLREDGVIFVSIDDHEVHNLRMLMDEVFGEESFIGCFTYRRRQRADNRNQTNVSPDHEYVFAYARAEARFSGRQVDTTKYSNPDNDPRGVWSSIDLSGLATKEQRPNLHYDIIDPATGLSYPPNPNRGWSKSRAVIENMITEGRVLFPKSPTGRPREKKFLADLKSDVTGFSTWLDSQNVGFSTDGTREVTELLGYRAFDFPKSLGLLKTLIEQAASQNDIVLDFFAGSGTTAHAVLDLNQQDGGNRKFILVQLPEKTGNPQYPTISHITRERVRRVIAKLQDNRHSRESGNPAIQEAFDLNPLDSGLRRNDEGGSGNNADLGFRAFKLDSSNFKIWRSDIAPQSAEQLAEQLNLYADNIQPERSDQDRLYELILKSGRTLSAQVEKLDIGQRTAFAVGEGELLICLEPYLERDTLRALFAHKPQMVLCLDTAFDGNDALKTNTVLEAQSHGVSFKTV